MTLDVRHLGADFAAALEGLRHAPDMVSTSRLGAREQFDWNATWAACLEVTGLFRPEVERRAGMRANCSRAPGAIAWSSREGPGRGRTGVVLTGEDRGRHAGSSARDCPSADDATAVPRDAGAPDISLFAAADAGGSPPWSHQRQ